MLAIRSDIELITKSADFFLNDSRWHGILGLGYRSLAVKAEKNIQPTPFFDSLVKECKYCYNEH